VDWFTIKSETRWTGLPAAVPGLGDWSRCGTPAPPTVACVCSPDAAAPTSSASSHSPQTEKTHMAGSYE